jgi:enterochelin esterase-like enzyme
VENGHHPQVLSRKVVVRGGLAAAAAAMAGGCSGHQESKGRVEEHAFTSKARGNERTGWSLILPPGKRPTRLVVALHGLHEDHDSLTEPSFGLDRALAAYVDAGGTPYAIAAPDGGTTYWHPRPDGEDAGAMVVDELLPRLARMGLDTDRFGLIGWSMGGYGALRLAGILGPRRVSAVVASSPALWTYAEDASPSGFATPQEYAEYSVMHDQARLRGIPTRIDVGRSDPFHDAVETYVAGFDQKVVSTSGPGGHDRAYWQRMLPAQLAFLGGRRRQHPHE